MRRALVLLLTEPLVLPLAATLSGCNQQADEDVAAIRALMEKQEAEKKAREEESRRQMEELKRKARESAERLNSGK
jgi:NADH:ubiquinone oxidoreductase subunit B-like Fe-S oxidoreductase